MKAAALWYGYLAPNYGENIIDESYHFKLNQSLKAIGGYRKANLEHCIKNYKQNGYFRGIDLKNLNKE
ncbi:MAG: hypothetical protein CR994_03720 [Maribacter sp.]|nr:MAG: hypothetical protein CR994_03720 [Maribacter sp.]